MKVGKIVGASAFVALAAFSLESYSKTTIVSGEVMPGMDIDHVVIMKEGAHFNDMLQIKVPVVEGKFSYTLVSDTVQVYMLVPGPFKGFFSSDWMFFTDGQPVTFRVERNESGESDSKCTASSPMSAKLGDFFNAFNRTPVYKRYEAFNDSIESNGLSFTLPEYTAVSNRYYESRDKAEMDSLRQVMKTLEAEGKRYSQYGLRKEAMEGEINRAFHKYEMETLVSDSTEFGLYMIVRKMWDSSANDHLDYYNIYKRHYSGRFAGHPYSTDIETLAPVYLEKLVEPGKKYTDVKALDADGKMRYISEFIGGKVALIDLWASWCGPCRRNSKAMIPVYDKYHPLGFEIVGIGREADNDGYMRLAVDKDGYKWPCLAEINDVDSIWYKYGTPNAPGLTVLVDSDGTILAKNPSVDELEKILTEKFSAK